MEMDQENEEISRLWKVNRTIHELVRDRVGAHLTGLPEFMSSQTVVECRDFKSQMRKFIWICLPSKTPLLLSLEQLSMESLLPDPLRISLSTAGVALTFSLTWRKTQQKWSSFTSQTRRALVSRLCASFSASSKRKASREVSLSSPGT